MDIQIRLSEAKDLDNILKLQADSLRALSPDYNSNQIESLIRDQALIRFSPDEIVLVAEKDSDIVGFSSLITYQSRIGSVYVHPNFARKGIGTRLIKAIEEIAIESNCKKIDVTSSLAAVNFYQANGYQMIRQSGFYSEGRVWVACTNLSKQLVNEAEFDKICLWLKRIFF